MTAIIHNHLPQSLDESIDHGMNNKTEYQDCAQQAYLTLLSLPSEVLIMQLSYLSTKDIERSVQFTCKSIYSLCNMQHLWREFCLRTGKLEAKFLQTSRHHHQQVNTSYKHLYRCIPCVPIDFPNIQTALSYYHTVKDMLLDEKFTITLMPGVYHEQILLDATDFAYDYMVDDFDITPPLPHIKHHIEIRAANRDKGAAIVHCDQMDVNEPCISISFENHDEFDERERSIFSTFNVTLKDLQILHYTRGNDIWNGNCVLQVDGPAVNVNVLSCSFQSDSGRGVVVSQGAHLNVIETNVHDCAATGIYIGDLNSNAFIQKCNIMRNGGGTRIPPFTSSNEMRSGQYHERDNHAPHNGRNNELDDGTMIQHDLIPNQLLVPPGHSGMYLEASTAIVDNCLLSKNSLTGLSVVRGGNIKISSCDIIDNGDEPFTIEDAHDVFLGLAEGIQGGIEDLGGNFVSSSTNRSRVAFTNLMNNKEKKNRDNLRKTKFMATNTEHLTMAKLYSLYNKSYFRNSSE